MVRLPGYIYPDVKIEKTIDEWTLLVYITTVATVIC